MRRYVRVLIYIIAGINILFLLSGRDFSQNYPNKVFAEGSKELVSYSGYRPYLEDSSSTYTFGSTIVRRTNVFYTYASTGEIIYLGSSAQGLGNGRINYSSPTGVTGSCGTSTTTGRINNITGELAGPLPNTNGYIPCTISVATGQAGIWTIRFISPSPTAVTYGAARLGTASWTAQGAANTYITAWDITVRSSTGTTIPGRTFMPYINNSVGSYAATFNVRFFIKTQEGFLYDVFTNQLQSYASLFFANSKGLYDSGSGNPIFKSMARTSISGNVKLRNPMSSDTSGSNTHKMFLNTPDPTMPAYAPSASGSMRLNSTTTEPSLSNFVFYGYDGTTGQGGTYPLGGYFTFDSNTDGLAVTIVDLNHDGIYGNANDAVLQGFTVSGHNSTFWNALDGLGNPVPSSGATLIEVKIIINGRGIHFPLRDAEENTSGLIIKRVNGLNSPDYAIFYDDTLLAGGTKTNILSGESSLSGAHKRTGTNNIFHDTRSFIPSTPQYLTSVVIFNESDLSITKTYSGSYIRGATGNYTIVVRNDGPAYASGANVIDTISPNFINSVWSCRITAGSGAGTSCGSGTGNIDRRIAFYSGGIFTYLITGNISWSATGTLLNSGVVLRPLDDNDPDDPYRTGANDNGAIVSGTIISPSDLLINITPNRGGYVSGDTVTFNIRYQNSGIDTLPITITGALPAGITGRMLSTGSMSGGIFTITLPPIGPNGSGNITLSGIVTVTGGMIPLTGYISSKDIQDINTGNNTSSASISVALCAFFITTGNALSVYSQTSWTNPGNATGPVNGTIATATAAANIVLDMGTGFATGTTFAITRGKTSGGGSASITTEQSINGTVFSNLQTFSKSSTTLANVNYITTSGAIRYLRIARTVGNVKVDAASRSLSGYNCPAIVADLSITKNVNITTDAYSGNIIIYTINYANLGDDTSTGVNITDTLPTGITGLRISTGVLNGYVFNKTGLTLTNGQTGSITITGRVISTGASIINTANISGNALDPYTGNNSSTVTTTIDTTPPTAIVDYTPGTRTSGNVYATITGFSEPITGLNATGYLFTGNGSFVFTFRDLAGNTGYTTGIVTRIDKIPPTFTGVISGELYENRVAISFSDANLSGVVLSGLDNSYYSGNFSNGSTFERDGTYILTVYDLAGNSSGATFSMHVSILMFSGVSTGTTYSGDVNISYRLEGPGDDTISGAILSGINGNSYYSGNYQSGATVTQDGTYIFTVYESDGDTAGAIFTIDKTKPTATIIYMPGSGTWTSGNVYATITGFSEPITGLNATGYLFTGNGSFVFTFMDLIGNTGNATATVTRIDKISPTLTGVVSGSVYETGITIDFSDAHFSGAIISGLDNEYYSGSFTPGTIFTEDGEFVLTIYDLAGNSTGVTFTMDTSYLYITGIISGNTYNRATIGFGLYTLDPSCTLSGAILSGLNNSYYSGNYQSGTTVTEAGTYILTVYETDGDSISATFTIDTEIPTANVIYSTTGLTNQNVIATLTEFSRTDNHP